ncbi:MAG: prolipoprotein diacylglyceryl transferase [Clostridia bacterium]|nr:prolipoprotein diacylglyceryl transferase [Clostridia bacterium]
MKKIKFEGLGIEFNINGVAINIFGIDIYWYAILIIIAFLIAIYLAKRDDGKYGIKYESVLQLLVITIPITIICARIYYVLFNLEYYIQKPIEIINIRNGGLAIYGGIIGAIITIYIYCKKNKINALNMLDYISPYLPLGQAIGRWGNFFNGEAYGIETHNIFRMGIMENGVYKEVHPTFLYESICNFIIFVILYLKRNKRNYEGQLTYLYFFLYGIARSIIEGIRVDSLMLGDVRVSQILSIILVAYFGILLFKSHTRR